MHSKRRCGAPRPWTDDVLLHVGWFECPLDEWDVTTISVEDDGAYNVGVAARNLGVAGVELARQCFIAIAAARSCGGRKWCSTILARLAQQPQALSPLFPEMLHKIAWSCFEEIVKKKGEKPFTQAHRPQMHVAKTVGAHLLNKDRDAALKASWEAWTIARTCGGDKSGKEDASTDEEEEEKEEDADSEMEAVANDGDEHAKRLFRWDFVFAYATIVAACVLEKRSCGHAALHAQRVPGWGQTQLVLKTIIRDLRRVVKRLGLAPLPDDFYQWGPSGPGSRRCSVRFRYSAREWTKLRPAQKRALDASCYTAVGSCSGRVFAQELQSLHEEVLASPVAEELQTLAGHQWSLHDTQGGQCVYEKYCTLRAGLLGKESWPSRARWYAKDTSQWRETFG